MKINEVVIDNLKGAGAVPNNDEIDYKGFRVLMTPRVFLNLALPRARKDLLSATKLGLYIKNGGAIASPFLSICIPKKWNSGDFSQAAIVVGHEGRNRMTAILETEGNMPIETHLFIHPDYFDRSWITQLNKALYHEGTSYDYKTGEIDYPEINTPEQGPFFTLKN